MSVESDDTEPVSGLDLGAVPSHSTKHWSERPARWGLTGVSVNMLPTGSVSPYQNPNTGVPQDRLTREDLEEDNHNNYNRQ